MNESVPWVEKYRPSTFEDIVLDNHNRKILSNLLHIKGFANVIFYGPPGTGKTTTIINLIKKYQEIHNENGKDLIIHLNASDERGIDVMRNQIQGFVESKNLFNIGHKFVILDEVDYMTKNAQQALQYIINVNKGKVSFCLICNYISKIDISLRDEFINFRFNQLPKEEIVNFLGDITSREKLTICKSELCKIQHYFKSDIRSMINYLQSNQNLAIDNFNIISNSNLQDLYEQISSITLDLFRDIIYKTSIKFNVSRRKLIFKLLKYLYTKTFDKNIMLLMIDVFHSNGDIDLLTGLVFYSLRASLCNSSSK